MLLLWQQYQRLASVCNVITQLIVNDWKFWLQAETPHDVIYQQAIVKAFRWRHYNKNWHFVNDLEWVNGDDVIRCWPHKEVQIKCRKMTKGISRSIVKKNSDEYCLLSWQPGDICPHNNYTSCYVTIYNQALLDEFILKN